MPIIACKTFTARFTISTDNTILERCIFRNFTADTALRVMNCSNIIIRNCLIENITGGAGITMSSLGGSNNVVIENCTIINTELSGIIAAQRESPAIDHTGLVIRNCTLTNNGWTSDLHHNIYVQSRDFLIENNTCNISAGNAISVRSSGTVRNNKILGNTGKAGIKYFPDHDKGVNPLIIENNLLYYTTEGSNSDDCITLLDAAVNNNYLPNDYFIRYNTVLSNTNRYCFQINDFSNIFGTKNVRVYGNAFINPVNASRVLRTNYISYNSKNYTSTNTSALNNPPDDFSPATSSPLYNYAAGELSTTLGTDINGVLRTNNTAGAYN